MTENLTRDEILSTVVSALAEVQRRPLDHYEGRSDLVISSSDASAIMIKLEHELGCEAFHPNDLVAGGAGGHAGLCYDPVDDISIKDLCEVVQKVAESRSRVS